LRKWVNQTNPQFYIALGFNYKSGSVSLNTDNSTYILYYKKPEDISAADTEFAEYFNERDELPLFLSECCTDANYSPFIFDLNYEFRIATRGVRRKYRTRFTGVATIYWCITVIIFC
jgi:hypothetical protein